MSVQLYKKGSGRMEMFDPYNVNAALDSGEYCASLEEAMVNDKSEENEEVETSIDSEEHDEGETGEGDTGDGEEVTIDNMSDDEIRVAAKEAKIGNWHNKNIDNLKIELKDASK